MRKRVVKSFSFGLALLWLATVHVRGDVLYVANNGNSSVDTISTTHGAALQNFAKGVDGACGVACDWQGNVYSLDLRQGRVYKISKAGVISVIATGLDGLEALAFNSYGDLFVASQGGTITRITRAGQISAFAKLPDELYGLAIDAKDNLYVTHHNTGEISKITQAGQVSAFANLSALSSSAGFTPTTVGGITYVGATTVTSSGGGPNVIPSAGGLTFTGSGTLTSSGGASLTFNSPSISLGVVVFDPHGTMFVASQGQNAIFKVDKSGAVSPFATGVSDPTDIAFDSHGEMFVAGGSRGVIYEVSPTGVVSTLVSGLPRLYGLAGSQPLFKLAPALSASSPGPDSAPHVPGVFIFAFCAPAVLLLVGGMLWLGMRNRSRRN